MTLKNPNAAVGLGSGIAGGQLVVNIAQWLGYHISTGWGIAIAGAVSGAVLFIGREGVVGAWNLLLHGSKAKAAPGK